MATFFGEVLPVFSRAVDDEDEEEQELEIRREVESQRKIVIQWSLESRTSTESTTVHSLPCSTFLIAVGQNAVGFLNSFVQCSGSWEIIGAITLWNERVKGTDTKNQQFPTDSSCRLYRLTSNPTILTCHCNCYVAEDQLFQWTDKIFGNIQKRNLNVIVLSSGSVTEYKTPTSISNISVPLLRALKTSAFQETPHCVLLEQPNVISGLPASVLSYCQVQQIPAVLYHCYSDVTTVDSLTIEAFRPVLACKSLSCFVKDTSRSAEILKQLIDVNKIQSNLYT
ncbi:proteasome assembly chaperone 1 [Stegostoma tigrinum]|uniref:proteasome assembly chaperone 1 n=1 Tax=Stegostoma tigrinum TaxID=3053191 RepID=UPI00202B965E|nr:proteasome assembly chaperone 1 [Stegostoma tigrinum]